MDAAAHHALGFKPIADFDSARSAPCPQDRLRALRHRGQQFHECLLDEPVVRFARSFNLLCIPYPAWFAFTGVYSQQLLKPHMVHLLARVVVIQFDDFAGQLRTLLFTPADFETGSETPYFKRLSDQTPKFLHNTIAPVYGTVLQALAQCGITPGQVDYITYDHLHTQNLRRWLGSADTPGMLPNAKLLVHQQEVASVQGLLPSQADWYCPQGMDGVAPERVVPFAGSVQLGPGLALVHTPGHTEGNHSLVYRTPDGIRVSSENGVSADSWAPAQSRHNGIRRYAKATGAEVILNGNTQENSVDQYLSMVLEKTIAGASAVHGFSNVVPSAECTPYWLFPGAPRSLLWGETAFGTPTSR
nr:hypothetical protein [uncultured Rhodoferax sp.]